MIFYQFLGIPKNLNKITVLQYKQLIAHPGAEIKNKKKKGQKVKKSKTYMIYFRSFLLPWDHFLVALGFLIQSNPKINISTVLYRFMQHKGDHSGCETPPVGLILWWLHRFGYCKKSAELRCWHRNIEKKLVKLYQCILKNAQEIPDLLHYLVDYDITKQYGLKAEDEGVELDLNFPPDWKVDDCVPDPNKEIINDFADLVRTLSKLNIEEMREVRDLEVFLMRLLVGISAKAYRKRDKSSTVIRTLIYNLSINQKSR